MEILMLLTYAAICYAVFKLFRIPVNKWTIPTAALGGLVLIFFVLLLMNYNHPFTSEARLYFYTTPIIPQVQGKVIEVPVLPNTPVKQGDVLFRLDPRPFQYVVDQKRAALAEAEQNVLQMKSAFDAATANLAQATASRDRSKQAFERYQKANTNARSGGGAAPVAEIQIENQRGLYLANEAAVTSAAASAEQARLAYSSQIGGVNTTVARLEAELKNAEYDLDQTTVRAPADGYIAQLFLQPGMMATPLPLRPVMVFVNSKQKMLGAAFQQNALQRVRVGDDAEIAFDGVPGEVFKGKVGVIIDAVAQGELQPTGALIDPEQRLGAGRVIARIDVTDDLSSYQLPGGAVAQVAVYTDHWHELALLRRILLRMKSWENYVFLEGH